MTPSLAATATWREIGQQPAVWEALAADPALAAARAWVRDLAPAEAWLMAGAPHHTVLSQAVGVEVLEDFAEMVGVEMVTIDADTTPRSFQRELRWNAAYQRLAARL